MTPKRKPTKQRTKVVKDDFARAIKLAADAVPTSWLDNLLTGPKAALPTGTYQYTCPDIERLLSALKARIQAIAPTKGKRR